MDLAAKFSIPRADAGRRPRTHLKRLLGWSLVPVLVLAIAMFAWRYATSPVAVSAMRVTSGPVAEVVYATGFVEPRQPVEISSRVTAPVSIVLADEGDRVSRGQALAVLDSEDQRQTIRELSALRVNAEQDERRALALFQQGFLANAARDKAVASATSARAIESAARARLDQYTIRSGISGVILRRDVEPGDLATATKTLFEIGDPNLLRVTATVDERDIPLVRAGAEVMMSSEAFPDRVIHGRVSDITPGGDPDQRAFRVRIQPDRAAALPIGLTLEVNIIVSRKRDALLVAGSAIRDQAVWAVEDGRARKKPVATGIRGAERTEIIRGAELGACIVTHPAETLKDGQRVSARGC